MSCPHCVGARRVFGRGQARRDLRRYRKNGPDPVTRLLLDAIRHEGVQDATLLDIGGGVGVIQHELLEAGLARATSADASPAYLEASRQEARKRGLDGRVQYHAGDFVDLAPALEDADVVTLNRVICCYPHMEELVGRSAARARRLYGLVFPRDEWWMRPPFWILNALLAVTRNPFRVFVHRTRAVERILECEGLRRRRYHRSGMWQVAVWDRAPNAAGPAPDA